jgi:thymidylate synthase (FAD)
MHFTNPKVFVIAETKMHSSGAWDFLKEIGATTDKDKPVEDGFVTDARTGSEWVIEVAGRLCYRSFKPQLNLNVHKVREGNKDYLHNILKQKHGSVLEHASVTFACTDVSRIFTHELVRHRAGVAISQESGRFVRIDDIGMFKPTCFTPRWLERNIAPFIKNPETVEGFDGDPGHWAIYMSELLIDATTIVSKTAEDRVAFFAKSLLLDDPKMPFHIKKELTSALRRTAPGGMSTHIIFTANHRAIRHMIAMRTAIGAEEEIRQVFGEYENDEEMRDIFLNVANQMKKLFTSIYQDMTIHNDGTCTFTNEKV